MRTRFVLKRYVSKETHWTPGFVLQNKDTGGLVVGRENSPVLPFIFPTIQATIDWVRFNAHPDSSVEWEGTTY